MINRSSWLVKLLPPPADEIVNGVGISHGYKRFSRGLAVILMVLVLVPLAIISLLSYLQYEKLLQQEELDQLILNLEVSSGTIEKSISELKSIVQFVARDDRYEELLDPKELKSLFVRLQEEYPGFVDIEVIDAQGMQKSYVGPYKLSGHNYIDQIWYQEVLRQGVYISDVFSGFRQVPHFVIAVSKKHLTKKGNWVLRVTIDGETLQNIVDTISTTYADDIFLVNEDCFPQTKPQKYGKIGEKCVLPTIEETTNRNFIKRLAERDLMPQQTSDMLIVQKSFQGQKIIHAIVNLTSSPWRLVLVKEQYIYADAWRLFQIQLICLFVVCAIFAVFVILEICSAIARHLRESDKKRQQFLAEAEHSNKLASIGRLAAGVAHEINNPLSIINQKAGLVQDFMEFTDDFAHKGAILEALDGVQSSVVRCKTITHRLLGFSRQTDVESEVVDVNATLRDVIEFLAKEAAYNQIKIDFDLNDIRDIISDRGQLQQIFLNIANNAIDAIGSNGKISLSSRQVDNEIIQVKITDDGPGMSKEVQRHIFEPFFTTKGTGKGTGLGLSITYGLVKKLGGKIKVKSTFGRGTTFEITLPVTQGNGNERGNDKRKSVNN